MARAPLASTQPTASAVIDNPALGQPGQVAPQPPELQPGQVRARLGLP
jgi:hypothetical protein